MNKRQQYQFLRHAPANPMEQPLRKSIWLKMHIDLPLLTLLCLASLMGIVQLYSASGSNLDLVIKQIMSFFLGLTVLLFLAQIPPRFYQSVSPWMYVAVLGLLVMVALFGGLDWILRNRTPFYLKVMSFLSFGGYYFYTGFTRF